MGQLVTIRKKYELLKELADESDPFMSNLAEEFTDLGMELFKYIAQPSYSTS